MLCCGRCFNGTYGYQDIFHPSSAVITWKILCYIFFERFGQCNRVSTSTIHWFRSTHTLPEIFRLSFIIVLKQWKWLRWLFNSILVFILVRYVNVADTTWKGNESAKDAVTSNSLQIGLLVEQGKKRDFSRSNKYFLTQCFVLITLLIINLPDK